MPWKVDFMVNNEQLVELNERNIIDLPYKGPLSRRIYVVLEKGEKIVTEELFIQRADAFTTNLISLINRLKDGEISEIKYFSGYGNLIRIFVTQKGKLSGEYFSNSKQAVNDFKRRLGI